MRLSSLRARISLLLLVSLLLPATGYTHARLVDSLPAQGEQLDESPAVLILRFSEPVQPVTFQLVPAEVGAPRALRLPDPGELLEIALTEPLEPGDWALRYRVVSADAHPVGGSIEFRILGSPVTVGQEPGALLAPSPAPPHVTAPPGTTEPSRAGLLVNARALYMALLLLSAGGALFLLMIDVPAGQREPLRRWVAGCVLGGLIAGLAYLQFSGAVLLGGDRGWFDPAGLRIATGSSLGTSVFLASAGWLMLLAGLRWPQALLLGAGVLLLVVSRALTGHPASRDPSWLLMPLMVLHVSCAAWWAGGLWPLHRLLGSLAPEQAAPRVRHFSVLAMAAVAVLVFAGLLMALVHLSVPGALLGTGYGRLLIAKVMLLALLLAVAAWHKLALTPRLFAGDAAAARRMRLGIRVEAVLLAALILTSVTLAGTMPEAPPAW
ncbi:MAG: copper resistance protein CopC/CopD [Chromatiales bacterium]|nr:copper resistance protein CopC/CopD [Chromatiales bacterium]